MAKNETPDFLDAGSLEWTLAHVLRYGDTDIFPVPFEYHAIKHSWTGIVQRLQDVDLSTYRTRPHWQILVPKGTGRFRVATQLDPIDTLLYTAMVYEAAERIEASRVARDRNIACSYRVAITADGSFFGPVDGWSRFHEQSLDLVSQYDTMFVAVADIADFYNQAYHHRVENAVESAGVARERALNVERFLGQLTAKHSRGLPVGPFASIILAEACMNDVDSFLLRRGVTHVRYVDDFRIFCRTRREAIEALHELTKYLYTSHRLALQSAKTWVLSAERFSTQELHDPKFEERRELIARVRKWIDDMFSLTGYTITEDQTPKDVENEELRSTLVLLFEQAVTNGALQVGLARYVLRRASAIRTRGLYDIVFSNLEKLAPVFRDVAQYLSCTLNSKKAAEVGPQWLEFLESGDVGGLPFVRLWGVELILARPKLCPFLDAIKLVEVAGAGLGIRACARLARVYGQVDWVREQKETWANHAPWDRRAIIWAGSILPADERGPWLRMIKESSDFLDGAVAAYADEVARAR